MIIVLFTQLFDCHFPKGLLLTLSHCFTAYMVVSFLSVPKRNVITHQKTEKFQLLSQK